MKPAGGKPRHFMAQNGDAMMPSSLYAKTMELAKAFRTTADALEEAFLKRADARAVQGGAICEEASEARKIARQLKELACVVEDAGI